MTTRLCNDRRILELCSDDAWASLARDRRPPMISPFVPDLIRQREAPRTEDNSLFLVSSHTERVISYGLSSAGYDVRCSNHFKVFTNVCPGGTGEAAVVDPKNFDERTFVEHTGDVCIIPPGGFVLTHTVETFNMPRNVLGIVLGKSTYARVGVHCLATPLEPGWCGQLVLEFSNLTPKPVKLYADEGCAQILFFEMNEPPEVSYADRGGKYQGQTGVQLPLV